MLFRILGRARRRVEKDDDGMMMSDVSKNVACVIT